MFNVLSVLQGCIFLFCLFIIQPWFYTVVKYCCNAIYFTRFIFVNSVIVSSIISCNDLYQDFIIMYVWYFVSRNSISVLSAIWPSLSPCTVINPILLTCLLGCQWFHHCRLVCLLHLAFDRISSFVWESYVQANGAGANRIACLHFDFNIFYVISVSTVFEVWLCIECRKWWWQIFQDS